MRNIKILILIFALSLATGTVLAGNSFASVAINCGMDEQGFRNAGAAALTAGNRNVYAGYRQVTGINQNPLIAAYDAVTGERVFCREDYEQTPVDGGVRGLHYNGERVYAFFRVDGGFTGQLLNAEASDNSRGWTRSVGPANSGNFAIVAGLDLDTGDLVGAAFITAQLADGKSNSVGIRSFECTEEGNVRVRADSFFSPRRIDGSRMTQTGSGGSPHDYTIEFTSDLLDVLYTSAVGWTPTDGTPSTVVDCPVSILGPIGSNVDLDVNNDGAITPADAIYVINRVGNDPTSGDNAPADVNKNGIIDAFDVGIVWRQIGQQAP